MKIKSINFEPLTFNGEDNMSIVKWIIRYGEKSYCTLTTNVVKAEFYLNQYGVLIHRFYIMDKDGKTVFKTSSPDECVEYLNDNKKKLIIDILAHLSLDDKTRELLKAVALYEEGGNNE